MDLFGYAYFEAGSFVRSRSGSANDGIFVNVGTPLPEEKALLDTTEERDGKRVFRLDLGTDVEYIDIDAYGEEFTMEVSRKAFGVRLDEYDPDPLGLQLFTRKPSWWHRFLPRNAANSALQPMPTAASAS